LLDEAATTGGSRIEKTQCGNFALPLFVHQFVQVNFFFVMQLTAKLYQVLPAQTGSGKNGQWKKQDIIVETEGQYPKKVCVTVWGDKIDIDKLQPGSLLKIDFDVESREFNGKWYTDVKAWKIDVDSGAASSSKPAKPEDLTYQDNVHDDKDDLPF
jgi:hypothetical protein